MRLLLLAIIGAGVFVAISATAKTDAGLDPVHVASIPRTPLVQHFTVQANGDGATCQIDKPANTGRQAGLAIAPACDAVLPGLSAVHYWSESPDGTVTLSADGKTPVAVFAQGDGVAYESIAPRTPLIALVESE